MLIKYKYNKNVPIININEFLKLMNNKYTIKTITINDGFLNKSVDILTSNDKVRKLNIINDKNYSYELILSDGNPYLFKDINDIENYGLYILDYLYADNNKEYINIRHINIKSTLYSEVLNFEDIVEYKYIEKEYLIDLLNPLININNYKFIFEDITSTNIRYIYNYASNNVESTFKGKGFFEYKFNKKHIISNNVTNYYNFEFVIYDNDLYIFNNK